MIPMEMEMEKMNWNVDPVMKRTMILSALLVKLLLLMNMLP